MQLYIVIAAAPVAGFHRIINSFLRRSLIELTNLCYFAEQIAFYLNNRTGGHILKTVYSFFIADVHILCYKRYALAVLHACNAVGRLVVMICQQNFLYQKR